MSRSTTYEQMRLGIASLRRKPYDLFSRKHSANGKPIPVPFLADDNRPLDAIDHGQVNNNIFTAVNREILCQVCGLPITDDDTTFFLLVDNDPLWRPNDDWDELLEYDNRFTEIDDESIPKMRSNSGPVHIYCGRISLRLCPAIESHDPNKIIGWMSPLPAYDAMMNDPELWIDNQNRNYNILAQVPRDRHITLRQLDNMVLELKNAKE